MTARHILLLGVMIAGTTQLAHAERTAFLLEETIAPGEEARGKVQLICHGALSELGLELDEILQIRRVIAESGRSDVFVDGRGGIFTTLTDSFFDLPL